MRALFGAASVVSMIGLLWASVSPAWACSCALPLTDEVAREVLEGADLVVAGAVAETAPDRVEISVERVYAGESEESVTVAQPEGFSGEYGNPGNLFGGEIGADCSYAISGGLGERYLLVLRESGGGSYEAQGCTSMALKLTQTDDYFAESFAAIERVAGRRRSRRYRRRRAAAVRRGYRWPAPLEAGSRWGCWGWRFLLACGPAIS